MKDQSAIVDEFKNLKKPSQLTPTEQELIRRSRKYFFQQLLLEDHPEVNKLDKILNPKEIRR